MPREISERFYNMRVFVTGATGFMGGHFVKIALERGYEVVALRRKGSASRIHLSQEPEWLEAGLTEVPDDLLGSCDALVHFAAQGVSPQVTSWDTAFDVNVQQSIKLMAQADQLGLSHIVCCGSCFEYGLSGARYDHIPVDAPLEPIGPYAASKAAFALALTALARSSDHSWTLIRPFHLYGEGQDESNFWPSLRTAALSGKDFAMTPGEQLRDYMPVEDAAMSFIKSLARSGSSGRLTTVNLGSGQTVTMREFAEKWWKRWEATGSLKIGALPYRDHESMRFVPQIEPRL